MTDSETPHLQTEFGVLPKLTANIKAAGCAAKIGAAELSQIVRGLPDFSRPELLTSIGSFEDAAVYKLSEDLALVQTIDFFPPVVDDPFLFGQIAAVNALSDVYAMGGRPILAMSVLCFPTCDYPLLAAQQIVAGGAQVVKEAGAALVGGHSIQGPEPIYGLSVTGLIEPKDLLTNGGAKPGDALVITKRIGTGISLLAMKGGVLGAAAQRQLIDQLTELNCKALTVGRKFSLHAATDVTGFGLIGHAHEMAKASATKIVLFADTLPLLDEARNCAEQGLVPAGAYGNRQSYSQMVATSDKVDLALSDLMYDPQTAGGLLFALPQNQAEQLVAALTQSGLVGAIIGRFEEGSAGFVEVCTSNETNS